MVVRAYRRNNAGESLVLGTYPAFTYEIVGEKRAYTSHQQHTSQTQIQTQQTHQLRGGGLPRAVDDAKQEGQRGPQPVEASGVAHREGLSVACKRWLVIVQISYGSVNSGKKCILTEQSTLSRRQQRLLPTQVTTHHTLLCLTKHLHQLIICIDYNTHNTQHKQKNAYLAGSWPTRP